MNFEESDRVRNILVGILAIGGLIVVAVVIGVGVFIFSRGSSDNNPGNPVAMPYNLIGRPLPTTRNIQQVFVNPLGKFTRKAISGTLSPTTAQRIAATYTRGTETVTIRGTRANNTSQAQGDMRAEALKNIGPDLIVSPQISFGYVIFTQRDTTVRILYHHNIWFWDITAPNRAVLDDFMKEWKY
jgi:hypothetical protein